jgi:hypothetical protein
VTDAGIETRPYIVALRGAIAEVVLLVRKRDGEKHRPLEFPGAESAQFLGFQKGGDPARKLYTTVEAITADARLLLAMLEARVRGEEARAAGELHDYEALELSMSTWTVREFERFRGNTMIELRNKVPLSQYEIDCSAVWTQLAQWVSHRAEVADDV